MAKILVVDDELDIVDLICKALTSLQGHTTIGTTEIKEISRLIEHHEFDLFIIDIRMPEKSGPELLKELRARGIKTPAIAITGYTNNSPMDDFVSVIKKPFELQDLISAVKDVLSHPREEGVDIT